MTRYKVKVDENGFTMPADIYDRLPTNLIGFELDESEEFVRLRPYSPEEVDGRDIVDD